MSDSKRRRGQGVLVAGWMIALAGVWVGTQRSAYGETGDRNVVASLSASVSVKLRKYIPHRMLLPTSYRPKKYTAKQMGPLPKYPKSTLSINSETTCVVSVKNNLYCWGKNDPIKIEKVDVGAKVAEVFVHENNGGFASGCVLLDSQDVRCWGEQTGYNVSSVELSDVAALGNVPIGGKVKQLSSMAANSCAVLIDGRVRCWGSNKHGALGYDKRSAETVGNGTGPTILAAGDVNVGGKVKSVSTNGSLTCAVMETGGVRCWGSEEKMKLGYRDFDSKFERIHKRKPTIAERGDIPLLAKAAQVVAGDNEVCALLEDGRVQCLVTSGFKKALYKSGMNEMGVLPLPEPAVQLTSDGKCAHLKNKKVICWVHEDNEVYFVAMYGKKPDKKSTSDYLSVPDAIQMAESTDIKCAQRPSGKVTCWGDVQEDSGRMGFAIPKAWVNLHGADPIGSAQIPFWKSKPVPVPEAVKKPF
jgi:hypothetical protein